MTSATAHISSLTQYPIKSCGGMVLEEAEVDASGFRGDRCLVLVDSNGESLSQDEVPRLALIQPRLVANELEVTAPGQDPLKLTIALDGESREAKLWHDSVTAIDQGDEAARWFGEFLGSPCRLLGSFDDHDRRVPAEWSHIFPSNQSRMTAVSPILLTSEDSLADLNGRIAKPIRMNRFRQSIAVEGAGAFHEDWWGRLRIGDIEFEKVISCERCGITQVDQETATRTSEPIRTLAKYRRQPGGIGGGIVFGIYFRPLGRGVLRLGDEVTVLEQQSRFVPNDGTGVVAEGEGPEPPEAR